MFPINSTDMNNLFNKTCFYSSKKTTQLYSTSFSSGILFFHRSIRQDIYNIYGFVRFADEIVDTYMGVDSAEILNEFKQETFKAIERGVSFNPIIHSFQLTVTKHEIDLELIHSFLKSMEMDLSKKEFNKEQFDQYVYGSAEVIGLMCLSVFTKDKSEYLNLKNCAVALGSAFQKINFIRDMGSDFYDRGRIYFPKVEFSNFSNREKKEIEHQISQELELARQGILKLPRNSRKGVFLAFSYYMSLFSKIISTESSELQSKRIRISNWQKFLIMIRVTLQTA